MTSKEQVLKDYPDAWVRKFAGKYRIVQSKSETDKSNLHAIPITPLCDTEDEAWALAAYGLEKPRHTK